MYIPDKWREPDAAVEREDLQRAERDEDRYVDSLIQPVTEPKIHGSIDY